jgi:hypothetical protein
MKIDKHAVHTAHVHEVTLTRGHTADPMTPSDQLQFQFVITYVNIVSHYHIAVTCYRLSTESRPREFEDCCSDAER